jgi:hypothetical protein
LQQVVLVTQVLIHQLKVMLVVLVEKLAEMNLLVVVVEQQQLVLLQEMEPQVVTVERVLLHFHLGEVLLVLVKM